MLSYNVHPFYPSGRSGISHPISDIYGGVHLKKFQNNLWSLNLKIFTYYKMEWKSLFLIGHSEVSKE